jgi:predicted RecB family nuclease
VELYGIVNNASTTSLEPGRKPIARGKDEATEEDIYKSSPQLSKLLRSEFSALVVGHRAGDKLYHYLPPSPARIHAFVYACSPEEVKEFSWSLDFLSILVSSQLPVPVEELVSAALRQMAQAQPDPRAFLVAAGKELAVLLTDFNQLKAILGRLK